MKSAHDKCAAPEQLEWHANVEDYPGFLNPGRGVVSADPRRVPENGERSGTAPRSV